MVAETQLKQNLIIDLGMHNGHDTDFYLRKGFSVVAVEANPALAGIAAEQFSTQVKNGELVILNKGIASKADTLDFYVNEDKDDWSSFIKEVGTRRDTKYHIEKIKCVPLESILAEYGIPYFIKIDIEGYEEICLDSLFKFELRPRYVSVEAREMGKVLLEKLKKLGYNKFKIVDQSQNSLLKAPTPAKEGKYVDYEFDSYSSGLFGEETPGDWLDFERTMAEYLELLKTYNFKDKAGFAGGHWYDIQARHSSVK